MNSEAEVRAARLRAAMSARRLIRRAASNWSVCPFDQAYMSGPCGHDVVQEAAAGGDGVYSLWSKFAF